MIALNEQHINRQDFIPKDFFGWLLFLFIYASVTMQGQGHLRLIGVLLAGSYTLFFLVKKQGVPVEIMIFFVWMVWAISTGYIVSVDKDIFFIIAKVIVQIVIMSFAICGITAQRGNLSTNFAALCIGIIYLVVSSIISGSFFMGMDAGGDIRIEGGTGNPNYFGYLLLVGVSTLLYFWGHNSSKWKKIAIFFLVVVFTTGIIYTGSRKAFLGLVCFIMLWLVMCYRRELLKRPSLIFAAILILGALYFTTDYMLSETFMGKRFQKDFVEDPITERREGYHRLIFYVEGLQMIKDSPLFGVGLGNFRSLSSLGKESHSDYIEVAASTGVVGFALYFSLFILIWRRLVRLQKSIQDDVILYNIGLIKAIIITILFIAIGRPNLTSQVTWVILSTIIGYTWFLERRILYLASRRRVHVFSEDI